ncbi:invasion associated locus B family protein [Mesorhizobium sp. KR9-304]|uniref:invasion associated locus B family protein n=1 Tax=Mesorhizobium sp. KR9-304 TaxID=3156614 RepID=UPI0032B5A024
MKQKFIVAGAALLPLVLQTSTWVAAQEQPPADAAPQPEQTSTVLTGGASALTETHGDWNVNCQIVANTKVCTLSHQQFDQAKNQRLLAIELSSRTGETANGTIAMPFGLELSAGVTLSVEEKPAQTNMAFKTCFAVGCLVPVNWEKAFIDRLKANKMLKISAVAADTQQPVSFTVSLRGFSSAIARVAELIKD